MRGQDTNKTMQRKKTPTETSALASTATATFNSLCIAHLLLRTRRALALFAPQRALHFV